MEKTRISTFMCHIYTLISQDLKLRNAKEIMRIKGITGIPVISEERKLVGIISMSDIIRVLEDKGQQGLELQLKDVMTTLVISLHIDDSLSDAVFYFRKYGYGRIPVIDNDNYMKGIITPKEMIEALLEKINQNDLESNESVNQFNVEDDINDKNINMTFNVSGGNFEKAGEVSSEIKKRLKQKGIDSKILRRIAIVTYEAEMNIIIHALRGVIMVTLAPDHIKVMINDEGPGIEDVDLAMTKGYSTATSKVRELGFGAGMGLPNIKKCSDEFNIESEVGVGTKIKSVIYY